MILGRLLLPVVFMLGGGALLGFGYIRYCKLLQPGQWLYSVVHGRKPGNTQRTGAPKQKQWSQEYSYRPEQQQNAPDPAKRVDDLLDKINLKGYNSLSQEERDFLSKAGKNNQFKVI